MGDAARLPMRRSEALVQSVVVDGYYEDGETMGSEEPMTLYMKIVLEGTSWFRITEDGMLYKCRWNWRDGMAW